jgi:photosystem II stability/assembly factor-like uncharacterized protein
MIVFVALVCLSPLQDVGSPSEPRDPLIEEVDTGVEGMLLDIEFSGTSFGLAVGGTGERDASLAARTTDGGATWQAVDVGASGRLYAVSFATSDVACVAGYGVLQRTVDAGATWATPAIPTGEIPWLGGVSFADEQHGIAVGGGRMSVIWRTDDGGATWTDSVASLPEPARDHGLRTVAFLDARHGIMGGDEGLLLSTGDAGLHWTVRPTGSDRAWMKGLAVLGEQTAYAVGSHGWILRTADAGESWVRCPFDPSIKLNTVGILDPATTFVGSMEGGVFKTRDRGASWERVHDSPGHPVVGSAVRPTDPTELWFACDAGILLRIRDP